MTRFLIPLFAFMLSTPAYGQAVTVLGQSEGSLCFEQTRDGLSPKLAIETCTRALNGVMTGNDRAYTLVNRSINLSLVGRYTEAHDDIDAAFELVPELAEAYLSRGNAYFLQKRVDDAIEAYSSAIEGDVNDLHKAYFNRALAYEENRDYRLAFSDYLSCLAEKPSFNPAVERIALYREEFGDTTWIS